MDETVHLFTSFNATLEDAKKKAEDILELENIIMKVGTVFFHFALLFDNLKSFFFLYTQNSC